MMSQRSKEIVAEGEVAKRSASPGNTIDEQRILDAAYDLLLAIGMRRMTMADISRRAGVSRATLYRRWPNVTAVVAALVTREYGVVAAASFTADAATARERLVNGLVSVVSQIREHPLLRKIVDVDPEFLMPYLLHRRGSSTEAHLAALEEVLQAGHADGSIRQGDPAWQARALLLTAMSFTLTGPIMLDGPATAPLDRELRDLVDRYVAP